MQNLHVIKQNRNKAHDSSKHLRDTFLRPGCISNFRGPELLSMKDCCERIQIRAFGIVLVCSVVPTNNHFGRPAGIIPYKGSPSMAAQRGGLGEMANLHGVLCNSHSLPPSPDHSAWMSLIQWCS